MYKKRIVLICPEPIRGCIQGIGIRFIEMTKVLGTLHETVLWTCNADIPGDIGVSAEPFPSGDRFTSELARTDAVVIHGHVSERYFDMLQSCRIASPPLAVDLYDPFLIENLQYTAELGEYIFYRDRAVLFRQLSLGDFFLASSEIQRMFYFGIMTGIGRITPQVYHSDRSGDRLIAIAPFGVEPVSEITLQAVAGKLKGQVPGIASDSTVIFFGGIYDWYDPETLINILDGIIESFPVVKVVFSVNPNQETTPQGVFKKIRDVADAKEWRDRHIFFIPWFPYRDRFAYLRDVDIAVCLHKPSLETSLSLRTRILDYMNAGIPVIATEGGEGGRILTEAGAALFVPPYNEESLRNAMTSLLEDVVMRRALGSNGRKWIQDNMTWEKSLRPLLEYCYNPYRSSEGFNPNAVATSFCKRISFSRILSYVKRCLKTGR
jgi:glycosyltransferase involved in cell wall biosynthesis